MKLIHSRVLLTFLAAALLAGDLAAARSATAQTSPAAHAQASACGHPLSETVYNVWSDLGGADGRLGCATVSDVITSTSPKGSAARAAVFGQNGEIVLHTSGPRAGQAYAVWG